MKIIVVTPPPTKPAEPALSGPAAAGVLRALGVAAEAVDASLGWHQHVLGATNFAQLLAQAAGAGAPRRALAAAHRAMQAVTQAPPPLRRRATYASYAAYGSAVAHLEQALAFVARPYPGLRLGIARIGSATHAERPESSAWLVAFASRPGPFDTYFNDELIPALARSQPTHVAVSLAFQEQAPAAFRLARLLRERLPGLVLLLGGPLVACWEAAQAPRPAEPFALFDRVLAGNDDELRALAAELGGTPGEPLEPSPRTVDLAESWEGYLAPLPVVPAALGRGCYWRRCTFCPDHLHAQHDPCTPARLTRWLEAVANRFPDGAMLHLTDSALPPELLAVVATTIARGKLPLRWHGFARLEPEFTRADFAHHLAQGGCSMLQFGVESGSPRLLALMGKGADIDMARRALRTTAAAGVRNHVYLLFGLPTETEADRELTLALVEAEAEAVGGVNVALLNLPRGSPMHRAASRFGITALAPFNPQTDLSLYDDFRCGASHPRTEARRWLAGRFTKSPRVRQIIHSSRSPFGANHLCFLPAGRGAATFPEQRAE